MTNQEIFELMARFDASTATTLKLSTKDFSLELGKGGPAAPIPAAAPVPASAAAVPPAAAPNRPYRRGPQAPNPVFPGNGPPSGAIAPASRWRPATASPNHRPAPHR